MGNKGVLTNGEFTSMLEHFRFNRLVPIQTNLDLVGLHAKSAVNGEILCDLRGEVRRVGYPTALKSATIDVEITLQMYASPSIDWCGTVVKGDVKHDEFGATVIEAPGNFTAAFGASGIIPSFDPKRVFRKIPQREEENSYIFFSIKVKPFLIKGRYIFYRLSEQSVPLF